MNLPNLLDVIRQIEQQAATAERKFKQHALVNGRTILQEIHQLARDARMDCEAKR